jgi:hypothetical protein
MKNKKTGHDKLAIQINKLLDKSFDGPNIYAFLIDQGVDSEIAESAQEFISEYRDKFWNQSKEVILKRLENKVEAVEAILDTAITKVNKVHCDILEGYIK